MMTPELRKPAFNRPVVIVLFAILFLSSALHSGAQLYAQGVVAAASPEAANAGRDILDKGGNAADAAVAVAFALAVTEPAMSGLGAGMQVLMMSPGKNAIVLNGTSFAPAATPGNVSAGDLMGHRLAAVPTSVRTLDALWRKHGSGKISWAQLMAPAIGYAENGFVLGPFRHKVLTRHADDLRANPSAAALFLNVDGSIPAAGSRWRQPVLARTLRRIAEKGADEFYRGDIARAIDADMRANNGWMTYEDLSRLPEPREQSALHGTYRGTDIYTLPPPASGWVVLQILNLMELQSVNSLSLQSASRDEVVLKALMTGHGYAKEFPVQDMINHERETSARISKELAERLNEGKPPGKESGETTHYSVVDRNGMTVAITTSINSYYGAWVATPSLGFVYNDYMREFELGKPDHPFALRAGAMPFSSMSATIAARNGSPVLALGSPGSARIISAVAQVAQRWLDGQPIAAAVSSPRLHVVPPDRVYVEDPRAATSTSAFVARMEWRIVPVATDIMIGERNAYFGGVHAVAFENGRWVGAADPRRDGAVAVSK